MDGKLSGKHIKTVTMREKDPKVARSFETRLALLEREMGLVLSDLFFLEELSLWRGILVTKAPSFSAWLFETKWREVLLSLAKLFESRRKTHEIRNFSTFARFCEEHADKIFYRTFFHCGERGEASGEENIPTPSLDDLFLSMEGFWEKHGNLVEEILAYRDKSLVHLTGNEKTHDFDTGTMRMLILDAASVLDGYAYKYDLGEFSLSRSPRSDFFRLLDTDRNS